MENSQYRTSLTQSDVVALLRAHRITPTQQRVEIAQILFAKPQHLSAEQVLGMANERQPVVSKATIYNTLGLFAEQGLIREVIVDPSKVFYDSNVLSHHHFYNVDTGTLTDIESDHIAIGALPNLPEGTVAAGIDVIIRVRNDVVPAFGTPD
ncbi:MAG: Fur family transcriptional regulator [Gammaproteobacteria bacterium]